MKLETLITEGWEDYALVDSGLGRKLERMGCYLIDRPEPQAMWQPRLVQEWERADAVFMGGNAEDEAVHGRWQNQGIRHEQWETSFNNVKFFGRLTNFRHVGFFPEQCAHWEWLDSQVKPGMKILNLFAYSGVHSLVAAAKGAEVTHVDASKKAITWARENQDLNDPNWKIRWIVEDAIKFVQREVKRGNKYDGILLDPPKFGRGPNGETWDLFLDLPAHLYDCLEVLKPDSGSFILMTSYAIRASAMAFGQLMADMKPAQGLQIECGELFVQEEGEGRLLPTSMFTRGVRR
ncbi:MAG: SAM-dependent methyltransferase [Alphaproteobacteria bacterium]|nr:SAM-dependent methyltransferase [Alphaproteobacteria bacterium]